MSDHNSPEAGFTLMEVLIGLFIMGVVAMLAWRGMDILLRSHSTVLERSANSKSEHDLVSQWVRDCETMVSSDEIDALQKGLLPFVQGNQNVWWVRSYQSANRWAWQIVGYRLADGEVQRWASEPLTNINEALGLWTGIYREPDLLSESVQKSFTLAGIGSWQWNVIAANPSNPSAPRSMRVVWRFANASSAITRACLAGVRR